MNSQFRYILEKGNRKRICPACEMKSFVYYVDLELNEFLPEKYGRCDREIKCTYHLNPYQAGYNKEGNIEEKHSKVYNVKPKVFENPSYTPFARLDRSRNNYEYNNFTKWLIKVFDTSTANKLVSMYFVGTSNYWSGGTVFWQIDPKGVIRGGKIMLYNPDTGKRVKTPFNHITWDHTVRKDKSYCLKQCLFGSHLLRKYPRVPVAVVESEKTAIVSSVFMPELVWVATSSLSNLSKEKCEVLSGREVLLFPDLGAYQKWKLKVNSFEKDIPNTTFTVSNLLEERCNQIDKAKGLDIADYLISSRLKKA